MVREKEGSILYIDNKCHFEVGFKDVDGKHDVKMIPAEKLFDFFENELGIDYYGEGCFKITQAHKKIDKIEYMGKCKIKKTRQKSVDNYD